METLTDFALRTALKHRKEPQKQFRYRLQVVFFPVYISFLLFVFWMMPEAHEHVLLIYLLLGMVLWMFSWVQYFNTICVVLIVELDIGIGIWFVVGCLGFLICQILLFAIMYKATGLGSDRALDNFSYVYFSVMTMTTVGYGDIRPVAWGRVIAVFQALSGYMYLGLFIGITVSLLNSAMQRVEAALKTKEE
jgi:hypothetical protein